MRGTWQLLVDVCAYAASPEFERTGAWACLPPRLLQIPELLARSTRWADFPLIPVDLQVNSRLLGDYNFSMDLDG